jgi:hypothetical protein
MKILKRTYSTAHVLFRGKHYQVSDNGAETLIFPADSNGRITRYVEEGGGRGVTLDEILSNWYRWMGF